MAEQGHLEGQKHLARTLEGVVSEWCLAGFIAEGVECHAEAGFDLLFGERLIVIGH